MQIADQLADLMVILIQQFQHLLHQYYINMIYVLLILLNIIQSQCVYFTMHQGSFRTFTFPLNHNQNMTIEAEFFTNNVETYFQLVVKANDTELLDRIIQTKNQTIRLEIPHPASIDQFNSYTIILYCHSHTDVTPAWNLVSLIFQQNFDHFLQRNIRLNANSTDDQLIQDIKTLAQQIQGIGGHHKHSQSQHRKKEQQVQKSISGMNDRIVECTLLQIFVVLACVLLQTICFRNYLKNKLQL